MSFFLFTVCADSSALSPKVTNLLQSMAEAYGSELALEKIQNLKSIYKVEMVGTGMEMEITILATTDKVRITTTMQGHQISDQGLDGAVAWSKDMMSGLRELSGMERFALEQGTLSGQFHFDHIYDSIRLLEQDRFDGKPVTTLLCQKDGMEDTKVYLDPQTYLVLATEGAQVSAQGKIHAISRFRDHFKAPLGLLVPKVIEMKAGPMSIKMSLVSIKENLTLDANAFAKPKA
jgi:hypothetical protein